MNEADTTVIQLADGTDRASVRQTIAAEAARRRGVPVELVTVSAVCPDCGGDHGRPIIGLPDGVAPVHASVTHPGAGSIVAIGDRPIGIDAERLGARKLDGTAAALGVVDPARLDPAPADREAGDRTAADEERLLEAWTRAEAVLKADGRGLRVDPRRIRFSSTPEREHLQHDRARLAELDGRWFRLERLDTGGPGLVVSLASEVPPPQAAPH